MLHTSAVLLLTNSPGRSRKRECVNGGRTTKREELYKVDLRKMEQTGFVQTEKR
jgi:hypothetical protein